MYTADQLMQMSFGKLDFIADNLLRPGLCVLAGSPKVGKSWLVLNLCLQVAKGEPFLGNKVKQSDVLYLALEDDARRLQKRLMTITDDPGDRLSLATGCSGIGSGLIDELSEVLRARPATRLIVIDTFQKIRPAGKELSYSNDYDDVSRLKKFADDNAIAIVLVHHTRKQADNDYMNEISGTNGIAGSADTLMVLKRESRRSRSATLSCTGRDIEDREFGLYLDRESCVWQVRSDSLSQEDVQLPEEITELVAYMKQTGVFEGTNSEFTEGFCRARNFVITPSHLKRSMNLYRCELEEMGVEFVSGREKNQRKLGVVYTRRHRHEEKPLSAPDTAAAAPSDSADRDDGYTDSLLNDAAYFPPEPQKPLSAPDTAAAAPSDSADRDDGYTDSLLNDREQLEEKLLWDSR